MYYLKDFCCICFSNTNELQNILNYDDDGITYKIKLTTTIPEMDMIDDRFICKKCCNDVDFVYKFRKQCLRSKSTLANYIAQLDSGHIMKGYLRILLTDLGNKKKDNDIIAQPKNIEKESVDCQFKHINHIEKINDNFKQEINDVSCNVKLEGSNYEQDIKDEPNQKYRIQGNVRNANYEEEIKTETFYSLGNETNLCFNTITEEIDIKTEYEDEEERDEEIIEDINTKIGSNIFTNNSMDQSESQDDPEKKLTVSFNSVFENFYQLKENNLTHDCSEPQQCTIGTETLPSTDLKIWVKESKEDLGNFKKHLKIHIGEKSYECSTCNKRFCTTGTLKRHMFIHTGEKPYECNICNKKFNVSSILKRHILIHTGEKAYECVTCNKRFSQSSHLKKHMLSHSGEKPYECNTCNKRFRSSSSLKRHMLIHSGKKPYKCNICYKKFNVKVALKKHMLIHTGEKAYKCVTCNKRFNQSSHLKIHMHSHTGEKP